MAPRRRSGLARMRGSAALTWTLAHLPPPPHPPAQAFGVLADTENFYAVLEELDEAGRQQVGVGGGVGGGRGEAEWV